MAISSNRRNPHDTDIKFFFREKEKIALRRTSFREGFFTVSLLTVTHEGALVEFFSFQKTFFLASRCFGYVFNRQKPNIIFIHTNILLQNQFHFQRKKA